MTWHRQKDNGNDNNQGKNDGGLACMTETCNPTTAMMNLNELTASQKLRKQPPKKGQKGKRKPQNE